MIQKRNYLLGKTTPSPVKYPCCRQMVWGIFWSKQFCTHSSIKTTWSVIDKAVANKGQKFMPNQKQVVKGE